MQDHGRLRERRSDEGVLHLDGRPHHRRQHLRRRQLRRRHPLQHPQPRRQRDLRRDCHCAQVGLIQWQCLVLNLQGWGVTELF